MSLSVRWLDDVVWSALLAWQVPFNQSGWKCNTFWMWWIDCSSLQDGFEPMVKFPCSTLRTSRLSFAGGIGLDQRAVGGLIMCLPMIVTPGLAITLITYIRLHQHLRVPESFTTSTGKMCRGEECFLVYLYHLTKGTPFTIHRNGSIHIWWWSSSSFRNEQFVHLLRLLYVL